MKLMAENTIFYSRLRQLVFLQMKPKWQMKLMAENTIFIVDLAN